MLRAIQGSANRERRAKPPRREGLLEAGTFEDLPGKWQAAIMEAEQNRPPATRVVARDKEAVLPILAAWIER